MPLLSGTVTDGEFCSLRSRGETRPLHLWQIIHDARDSVGKMSKTTLLKMLELIYGKISFQGLLSTVNKAPSRKERKKKAIRPRNMEILTGNNIYYVSSAFSTLLFYLITFNY